jgi:hypothetical protein
VGNFGRGVCACREILLESVDARAHVKNIVVKALDFVFVPFEASKNPV